MWHKGALESRTTKMVLWSVRSRRQREEEVFMPRARERTVIRVWGVALICVLGVVRPLAAQDTTSTKGAAPWVMLAEWRSQIFSVDTSRIEQDGTLISVWLRLHRRIALRDASGRDVQGALMREELDCARNLSRRRELIALDAKGVEVELHTFASTPWVPFLQHPIKEENLVQVCRIVAARVPA